VRLVEYAGNFVRTGRLAYCGRSPVHAMSSSIDSWIRPCLVEGMHRPSVRGRYHRIARSNPGDSSSTALDSLKAALYMRINSARQRLELRMARYGSGNSRAVRRRQG